MASTIAEIIRDANETVLAEWPNMRGPYVFTLGEMVETARLLIADGRDPKMHPAVRATLTNPKGDG